MCLQWMSCYLVTLWTNVFWSWSRQMAKVAPASWAFTCTLSTFIFEITICCKQKNTSDSKEYFLFLCFSQSLKSPPSPGCNPFWTWGTAVSQLLSASAAGSPVNLDETHRKTRNEYDYLYVGPHSLLFPHSLISKTVPDFDCKLSSSDGHPLLWGCFNFYLPPKSTHTESLKHRAGWYTEWMIYFQMMTVVTLFLFCLAFLIYFWIAVTFEITDPQIVLPLFEMWASAWQNWISTLFHWCPAGPHSRSPFFACMLLLGSTFIKCKLPFTTFQMPCDGLDLPIIHHSPQFTGYDHYDRQANIIDKYMLCRHFPPLKINKDSTTTLQKLSKQP